MKNDTDSYYTVVRESSAEYKAKGSRFIAYIQMLSDEPAFNEMLERVKSEHHKARHHCYAFRLKAGETESEGLYRSSDDGEPSGTAGRPILNQLLSAELEDTACIVVRYFGGTKLGTSGLIQAYKSAAAMAVRKGGRQLKYRTVIITIHFSYALMGQLMDVVKSLDYEIEHSTFDNNPEISIRVRRSESMRASKKIYANLLNREVTDIPDDFKMEGLRFEYPDPVK